MLAYSNVYKASDSRSCHNFLHIGGDWPPGHHYRFLVDRERECQDNPGLEILVPEVSQNVVTSIQ